MTAFILILIAAGLLMASWLWFSIRRTKQLVGRRVMSRWRVGLLGAALAVLALSVAPIGRPTSLGNAQNRNLDVYLMIDNSLSMKAGDYDGGKTRLAGFKADFAPHIDELAGSRFTLISFHGRARVELPGMYDTKAMKDALSTLEPPLAQDARGTAFVPALKLVGERMQRAAGAEKTKNMRHILIIVSDGERIAETAEAKAELESIKKNLGGALVVGIGTEKGASMKVVTSYHGGPNYDETVEAYVTDPAPEAARSNGPKDKNGLAIATSKADPARLQSFASALGGRFLDLHSSSKVVSELQRLAADSSFTPSDRQITARSAPNSFYWVFALISLILLWLFQLRVQPRLGLTPKKAGRL